MDISQAGGDDTLAPPAKTKIQDPGAHELESESDDHFSDAQSAPSEAGSESPKLPKTRVEKVDNEPSFGEVPGTEAYQKRASDAEPDEIAVASDSSSAIAGPEDRKQDDASSEKPQSDAVPDRVVKVDGSESDEAKSSSKDGAIDTPVAASLPSPPAEPEDTPQSPSKAAASASFEESGSATAPEEEDNDDDGDFGDDFDDFEEGGGDGDDDFGDFDDGFQEPVAPEDAPPPVATPPRQLQLYLSFTLSCVLSAYRWTSMRSCQHPSKEARATISHRTGSPRTSTDSRNITRLKQEAAHPPRASFSGNKKPRPSGDAAASSSTARKKTSPSSPSLTSSLPGNYA
ncbi:hypothetical protein MCOR02_002429 [Pyricularia oryzae]|nr:hypothetical protein MCOR02_002429 [Pyricularia oryzae]